MKGKAAEVRDLAPALLFVWREGMSEGDPMHIAILCALGASCRMEETLRLNKGSKLPPDLAVEFLEQAKVYVQNQVVVHNWNGDRLFNYTFKHHQLLHCADRAKYIHPRPTWCFIGEDYMKHTKKLAIPCAKGTRHMLVQRKILKRMLLVKHCRR